MERNAGDYRRLIGLVTDESEGLYWTPAIRLLTAARPDLLRADGPPSPLLRYIHVREPAGIRWHDMLFDLDWSGPLRDMVLTACCLFNGGPDEEAAEPLLSVPRVDAVLCRLDHTRYVAVLEAMQARRGPYGLACPESGSAREPREGIEYRYTHGGVHGELVDDLHSRIEHDLAVERIRTRLVDQSAPCSSSWKSDPLRHGDSTGEPPDRRVGCLPNLR